MMSGQDVILVAYVISAHGVQGAVRVKSLSQNLANYCVFYDKTGKSYEVAWCRHAAKYVIIKFKNFTARSSAEALKATELFVKKDQLPKLEAEEFYYSDLIGMHVVDDQQNNYGKIIAIHNFGAGELLEIGSGGAKTFMLPFKERLVPIVNMDAAQIIISIDALSYINI